MNQNNSLHEVSRSGEGYLVFQLANETYAVDILQVQEIRNYGNGNITRIPNAPNFIKGVTNIRGSIVPIVDLRVRLNLDAPYTEHTVVIVINSKINDVEKIIGFVVDSVTDVKSIPDESINPPPEFTVSMSSDYIQSIATIGEEMLIIIDMKKLISSEDMALIAKGGEE